MADKKEVEVPVWFKSNPDGNGTLWGIGRFASVYQRAFGAILRHPVVLGFIAITKGLYDSLQAWKAQEAAVNALNQSLVNQGIYTRELSQQYQDMALAFQTETAFGDEELIRAQAVLQGYLGNTTISRELMKAVVDFAAGQRMDLDAAAAVIGRTIGTTTNGLAKAGVVIDMAASKQEKLAAVIDGISQKWGGQAEASTKGLGALEQARHALTRLMETVGRALEPFVVMVAQSIGEFARAIASNTAVIQGIGNVLDGIGTGVNLIASVGQAVIKSVPIVLQTSLGAMNEVVRGNMEKAADVYRQGNEKLAEISRNEYREILRIVKQGPPAPDERLMLLKQSAENRRNLRNRAAKDLDNIFKARTEDELVEAHARLSLRQNAAFVQVNEAIKHEKDLTKLRELELQKRAIREEAVRQSQKAFAEKDYFLRLLTDKEILKLDQSFMDILATLKESRFGPQILIGKGAAIAQIIANTARAVVTAQEALNAIPPPVGPALATAFGEFMILYGKEQVENIIGSSIDAPGRIGQIQFNLPSILEAVWGHMGAQYEMIGRMIGTVLGFSGDLVGQVGDKIEGFLANVDLGDFSGLAQALGMGIGAIADIASFYLNLIGDIYETAYVFIGQIIQDVARVVAQVVSDVISSIGDAIADAADAIFGWLFAEGGVVTHQNFEPVVTPLHRAGIRLHQEVSVTIRGGLIPSPQEASRFAQLIAQALGR